MILGSYEHDTVRVPENGVSVELLGGVEPEAQLLLSVAFAVDEDVGVHRVRLATYVPQELHVYLIVPLPLRR